MRDLKIYLAGACKGLPDLGTTWRKKCVSWVKTYNELYPECKIITYDPTDYFKRDGSNCLSNKQVKNFYLNYLIKKSDLILVNLNDSINSIGTAQELQFCVDNKIPVIGFGKNNVYEWFFEDCDVVFDSLNDALGYIVDYFCE